MRVRNLVERARRHSIHRDGHTYYPISVLARLKPSVKHRLESGDISEDQVASAARVKRSMRSMRTMRTIQGCPHATS